jgi:hypothetical protein
VSSVPVCEDVNGDAPGYPHGGRWGMRPIMGSGMRNDKVMELKDMLSTSVDKAVNSCKSLIYER